MLPRRNTRKIEVLMVSVAVACLAVVAFLVDAHHEKRPVSISEERLASIQESLALHSECEFTEISNMEDFFAGLTSRVTELIPDEFSQKQREALVSFRGNVLIARSEGDWEKHRSALGAEVMAHFPEM